MDQNKPPQTPSKSVINEPEKDEFTAYKKDPRIDKRFYQEKHIFESTPHIKKRFQKIDDEEKFFDELRTYKREQVDKIKELENDPLKNRYRILNELSQLAEEIVYIAIQNAEKKTSEVYGCPSFLSSYKQMQPAHLAILTMGKFGSMEINYQSDLDMIFIYSNRGETIGKKVIDNGQFFVKCVQKFMNMLSLTTAQGRCYEIDTELRPSGNMGALITSYDKFLTHQMSKSENWERQALLRAHALCLDLGFQKTLQVQISKLNFERELPLNFSTDMANIRSRVLKERCKEKDKIVDMKLGAGGIMDIEFYLHKVQLKHARVFPDLQKRNLFELLDTLKSHTVVGKNDVTFLQETYTLWRTLESLSHLLKNRSDALIHFDSEIFEETSEKLGYKDKKELQTEILDRRKKVTETFCDHK